jgi:hypothetical protein
VVEVVNSAVEYKSAAWGFEKLFSKYHFFAKLRSVSGNDNPYAITFCPTYCFGTSFLFRQEQASVERDILLGKAKG